MKLQKPKPPKHRQRIAPVTASADVGTVRTWLDVIHLARVSGPVQAALSLTQQEFLVLVDHGAKANLDKNETTKLYDTLRDVVKEYLRSRGETAAAGGSGSVKISPSTTVEMDAAPVIEHVLSLKLPPLRRAELLNQLFRVSVTALKDLLGSEQIKALGGVKKTEKYGTVKFK